MAGSLLVAAGGGGDAIAAVMLHHALHPDEPEPPTVATYAWERLLIDPKPGPRSPEHFRKLLPLGKLNYQFTSQTSAVPPGDSTLPRLAGSLPARLVLLDPKHGAEGMRAQLAELAEMLDLTRVEVIDVGGDITARGDEPGLRSPLADAQCLAATSTLELPTAVLIAGPGLDGELSPGEVQDRVDASLGDISGHLTERHISPFLPILEWHPSEATALLAAAARGMRGTAEIRDSGIRVRLTDASADVMAINARDLLNRSLAVALCGTRSIKEAEDRLHRITGTCELDYERRKALRIHSQSQFTCGIDTDTIAAFETAARLRGVDFVTFRRMAEAIRAPEQVDTLRRFCITTHPERYAPPIWRIK